MLTDEKFAMHKYILALAAAGAVFLGVVETLRAEARPLGGGWGGRPAVSAGAPRFRGHHHGRAKFSRGRFVAADIGPGGGRYLSDSSWYLSDIGGYLADDEPYPALGGYGYGYGYHYGYPAYDGPVSYRHRRSASYTVPVHRSPHGRRMVTVHRGAPGRAISHSAVRPGRAVGR
jgi:hypothetical protein